MECSTVPRLSFACVSVARALETWRRCCGCKSSKKSVADDVCQCCIVIWAAGAGKTALLAAQDMLTEVVFDSDTCVFRSAPTRTAARLNRGDTVHAAWSLPWSSCLGTHGRLTAKPLQRLRQRLRGKEEATIEISMLPPDIFFKLYVGLLRA